MGGAVEKVWFALGQEFVRRGHDGGADFALASRALPAAEKIEGVQHLRVRGFSQPRSIRLVEVARSSLLAPRAADFARSRHPRDEHFLASASRTRTTRRGLVYVHVQRGPKGQMRWYAHVARLLAVSRAIADQIVAEAPHLRAKVRVIPNALPFRIDRSVSHAREQTILFVGRVHPEKGLELFLRALSHLPAEMLAAWKIRIVGPHETHLGGGGEAFLRNMQALGERSGARVRMARADFRSGEAGGGISLVASLRLSFGGGNGRGLCGRAD